jgi:UPF0042 nucleotide-binding protein
MIKLLSFGFLHGAPPENADFVVDVRRYIHDPAAENLINSTGFDSRVIHHVFLNALAVRTVTVLRDIAIAAAQSDTNLNIAVGCAGGRHRSVAIIEAVAKDLQDVGINASVTHLDVEKPRFLK